MYESRTFRDRRRNRSSVARSRASGSLPLRSLIVGAHLAFLVVSPVLAQAQLLPLPPVPPENPITTEKAVLGKILFWDEQLSSDDTVACGTCHLPEVGGADDRLGVHPGADGTFGTFDDILGSPGVPRRDATGATVPDAIFGFDVQVTERASQPFFGGLWSDEAFWDGRAGPSFFDPLTGDLVIPSGGALESQALEPILSDIEMAKEGRTWEGVIAKLSAVAPLALAADWPADIEAALTKNPSYPDLFTSAFGSPDITPVRIAFAIATYERTLVADQTPWDRYIAGDTSAMTASQIGGWNAFQNLACANCHAPPIFTDNSYANIGLRDPNDDIGRESVTGLPADRGRFKVPSLRNIGQRWSLMHTGAFPVVALVIDAYHPFEFHFEENLDSRVPVAVSSAAAAGLLDFLNNALTDPRLSAGNFPFDRPTLASESANFVPEPGGNLQLLAACLALWVMARHHTHSYRKPR